MITTLQEIKNSVSCLPNALDMMQKYLTDKCANFRAGRVQSAIDNWEKITSDPEILSIVSGSTIEFDSLPPVTSPPNSSFSLNEIKIIDEQISLMLDKFIIEQTTHHEGEFISSVFTRPKKDGTHRMILNLKKINEFVTYRHFKMDTLQSILNLVTKDCYMASLDLKDAYYSVAISMDYRKYLSFRWRNKLYRFTCLPNGLASCPRIFTKLLKPALLY